MHDNFIMLKQMSSFNEPYFCGFHECFKVFLLWVLHIS